MEKKFNKFGVRLCYEYGTGPIIDFTCDNEMDIKTFHMLQRKINCDTVIKTLNESGKYIYYAFLEQDKHNQAMWFNEELFYNSRLTLISLINLLKTRINKIGNNEYDILDDTPKCIFKNEDDKVTYLKENPEFIDGKKCIYIDLVALYGPLKYTNFETYKPSTGVDIIDNDIELCELNYAAAELSNSIYESNNPSKHYYIKPDLDKLTHSRDTLLLYIEKIIKRLDELNDGSFIVVDKITCKLKKL